MNEKGFQRMQEAFAIAYDEIEQHLLGADVAAALDNTPSLLAKVKRLVILDAFLSQLHSRDIVLTDTGFGIVSNNQVAPASRERVVALEAELIWRRDMTRQSVIDQCITINGWGNTSVAAEAISHIFCFPRQLLAYTSKSNVRLGDGHVTYETLRECGDKISKAEGMLRQRMSADMEALILRKVRCNECTGQWMQLYVCCCRFIGAVIDGNHKAEEIYYEDVFNLLDSDEETFAAYHNSAAWKANHAERYENNACNKGYFFG